MGRGVLNHPATKRGNPFRRALTATFKPRHKKLVMLAVLKSRGWHL
jgi:hypothetical protein